MAAAAVDVGLLALRVGLAIVFVAHGYNHIWGGGKIAGTARWFESLGMRPGIVHAWFASITELGTGLMLLAGFATPLACAGVAGIMIVAWITNHRDKGFFVFHRPVEGYEYVMTLTVMSVALAALGAGALSVDNHIGWFQPGGWWGLGVATVGGAGGAFLLLATSWRPERHSASS